MRYKELNAFYEPSVWIFSYLTDSDPQQRTDLLFAYTRPYKPCLSRPGMRSGTEDI